MGECLIMRRGGETYKPAVLNAVYPQDVSKTVIKGNTTSATFNVLIAEAGTPAEYTYQWYKDGVAVSGATSSSYTISGLGSTVTHTVYCEVTNKGGTVQSRIATLKVTQQYTPVLNTSYPANVTGLEIGKSATFKVQIATAGNPATYTYQWYVNGSAVSGATGSSYTRSNSDFGTFTVYCKVTNAAGTVQSRTATLTVTKQYFFKSGTGAVVPFSKNAASAASITVGTNSISITMGNEQYGLANVFTNNKIAFKAGDILVFDAKCSSTTGSNTGDWARRVGVYTTQHGTNGDKSTATLVAGVLLTADSTRKEYRVSIGSAGSYYVQSAGCGAAEIYNIWNERD